MSTSGNTETGKQDQNGGGASPENGRPGAASSSGSSYAEKHIQRTIELLAHERDTDLAQTSLLASKCSPKLLESRGLAILNLQVCSMSVGLGGTTLVELERWMKGPLPSHDFRNGDTCEILGNDAGAAGGGPKTGKGKGKAKDPETANGGDASRSSGLQGVVYRTHEDKIVIALNTGAGDKDEKDPDLPEKCRLCVAGPAPQMQCIHLADPRQAALTCLILLLAVHHFDHAGRSWRTLSRMSVWRRRCNVCSEWSRPQPRRPPTSYRCCSACANQPSLHLPQRKQLHWISSTPT